MVLINDTVMTVFWFILGIIMRCLMGLYWDTIGFPWHYSGECKRTVFKTLVSSLDTGCQ